MTELLEQTTSVGSLTKLLNKKKSFLLAIGNLRCLCLIIWDKLDKTIESSKTGIFDKNNAAITGSTQQKGLCMSLLYIPH